MADFIDLVALAAQEGWPADAVRRVETPCAIVYLAGDFAYKIKKPVNLGYLDFSSREKRLWATERELRFNRLTAPGLYLDILSIGGEPVLKMRRFPDDAVLHANPDLLTPDLAERLGRRIAATHAAAETTPGAGGAENARYVAGSNHALLSKLALPQDEVQALGAATQAAIAKGAALMDQRCADGQFRACHGDLHLGNIVVLHGEPVLFDCIEFNDVLRNIDVAYDLAFLLMDLAYRDERGAASRLLCGYLDEAARSFGDSVYAGLALLPLYASLRAGVRGHVEGNNGNLAESLRYVQFARACLEAPPPQLIGIGGRSGSGKTTYGRQIAPHLGGVGGAAHLRSDEIRKRLCGVRPLDRLGSKGYAPEVGVRVYDELFRLGGLCLEAGATVVLDAAFLRAGERDRAQAVAEAHAAPFEGVWMEAPFDALTQRVAARQGDASDAGVEVVAAQAEMDVGDITWRRLSLDGG